jgi:hypothetical protein
MIVTFGFVFSIACGGGLPKLGSDAGAVDGASDVAAENDSATPDGGCASVGPTHACGLAPQCGCDSHSTCDVDYPAHTDGTVHCVQSTSGAGIGSACSATAGCAPGLACWGSVCRPYCATPGLSCNNSALDDCEQWYDSQQAVPNATVCEIDCKLDDLYACGGGENGCIYINANETDCLSVGPASSVSCSAQNPYCAPGYVCLTDNSCAQWCEVPLGNCANNLQCTSLSPAVVSHGIEYGACL